MPYIEQADRTKFDDIMDSAEQVINAYGISNGELNYVFTQLGRLYLKTHGTSYNTISDVIKALECAKLEFYRRVAAPYEDKKMWQNGDMYV